MAGLGPAQLNENDKIERRLPVITDDFYFAHPSTGKGGVYNIAYLLTLLGNVAPVQSFANTALQLANTTIQINYFAYVVDASADPAVGIGWGLYLYQGPTRNTLASYTLIMTQQIQHYRGVFITKPALDAAVPVADAGDYADVDAGPGFSVVRYVWDTDDNSWEIGSAATATWGSVVGVITAQTDLVNYISGQIASGVAGLLDYRGVFNASTNTYPNAGGSGVAGAILKSDFYIVSVAGVLDNGLAVEPGDLIIAKVDAAGNVEADWSLVQYNIGFTPENIINKDVDATMAANSDVFYPSQKAVKTALALKLNKAGDTMSGNLAMGSNKVTGLAAASANGEAAIYEQIQDYLRISVAISAGTLTLDCLNRQERKFENTTAITSAFTLAFTNDSTTELIHLILFLTGSIPITLPSSVIAETINGVEGRFNNSTKILTLLGVTASPFELSFSKISSSRYLMRASYANAIA